MSETQRPLFHPPPTTRPKSSEGGSGNARARHLTRILPAALSRAEAIQGRPVSERNSHRTRCTSAEARFLYHANRRRVEHFRGDRTHTAPPIPCVAHFMCLHSSCSLGVWPGNRPSRGGKSTAVVQSRQAVDSRVRGQEGYVFALRSPRQSPVVSPGSPCVTRKQAYHPFFSVRLFFGVHFGVQTTCILTGVRKQLECASSINPESFFSRHRQAQQDDACLQLLLIA